VRLLRSRLRHTVASLVGVNLGMRDSVGVTKAGETPALVARIWVLPNEHIPDRKITRNQMATDWHDGEKPECTVSAP